MNPWFDIKRKLEIFINEQGIDAVCNAHDFVLAEYLCDCLGVYVKATEKEKELASKDKQPEPEQNTTDTNEIDMSDFQPLPEQEEKSCDNCSHVKTVDMADEPCLSCTTYNDHWKPKQSQQEPLTVKLNKPTKAEFVSIEDEKGFISELKERLDPRIKVYYDEEENEIKLYPVTGGEDKQEQEEKSCESCGHEVDRLTCSKPDCRGYDQWTPKQPKQEPEEWEPFNYSGQNNATLKAIKNAENGIQLCRVVLIDKVWAIVLLFGSFVIGVIVGLIIKSFIS